MPVPKYHEFMLPILQLANDGKVHNFSETAALMGDKFNLSEEEKRKRVASGTNTVLRNRVAWAITYLKKALALESAGRGQFKVGPRGHEIINDNPKEITSKYLKKYPEFLEFQTHKSSDTDEIVSEDEDSDEATPEEIMENAFNKINKSLARELIDQIMSCSPNFFERLVVDLLINLGYGGSRKDAGEAFCTTNDEGIDGTIKEDRLGLDIIYIQAKRWKPESTVGRPEIQKFAGALQGKRAKKGIFITTSKFSREAHEFSLNLDSKIILIDGEQLAEHMILSNTGVSTENTYLIKKIDIGYFQDE